jgi:Subtilase family
MMARRTTVLTLVFLSVLFESFPVGAQVVRRPHASSHNIGVDVKTHKFRPIISPDRIVADASGAEIKSEAAISPSAALQMNSLFLDKQARTPAQKKISSQLIYTERMLRGLPAAPGVPSLQTDVEVDDEGSVLVDITADVTESFLAQLSNEGAYVYSSYPAYRSVRALVPAGRLEEIASWPNVVFIQPRQQALTSGRSGGADVVGNPAPTGQGSKTSEGDLTHRAFDARMAFGVNGAGIKIGVLSDGATNLAASQALGDLPGDVTVLPGQIGSGDEGTAMMEIVHDLAPGAKLYFATAFGSLAGFAQNIHDLRAAGCDIIIDDVFYFDENPFVDGQTASVVSPTNGGLVLQAVNDVTAAGTLYFSSAGNEGNLDDGSAGAYEGDFVDGGSLGLLAGGTVHLFGTNQYDMISGGGGNFVMLFWSDPLGASSNDYDLFVLNSTGTAVLEASTNIQDGSQDPIEWLSPSYNLPGNRLVVFKHTGAQNRYFHLNTFRGRLAVGTAGETHGHSQAALAYSVASTPAVAAWSAATPNGPYPNFFDAANQIELFSSDGPRRLFYQADGTAFTPGDVSSSGGIVRQKPDITAADGVSVTGVGGFGSPFYGTSAAAPHAGAIAALLKSASPASTPDELRTALTATTVDIMGVGVDRDAGTGVVMAFDALQSLGVVGSANPELGTITASDHPGNSNGMLEAGEGGVVTVQLKNTGGVANATAISAVLTTVTSGVTVTLPNTSVYADLPRLTGTGNNVSPFTFTLASDYPCGQAIDFVLTVMYAGTPNARALRFTVPTGPVFNLNTAVDASAPVSPTAAVTAATGTQTGRVSRNGVATSCGTTPKVWPGLIDANSRQYDSYTFTATQNACTTFTLTSANGINLFLDAYSPSFNAADIPTGFYADAGGSSMQSFSMAIAAGQSYALNVHDILAGPPSGTAYNLQFSGCAFASLSPNHVPVAQAHDVTAVADSNHTASASVDNGSYDPDPGDTITVTQTPAGPYGLGATRVVLTVVDSQGATAQASAVVTVVNPDFDLGGQALPPKAVAAGGSVTQTITIRPNPAPWNSVVTFACTGLPELATCTFTPTSVTPGSSNATTTLTVATTGPNSALLGTSDRRLLATWLGFGSLGLFVVATPRRGRARTFLAFLLFGILAFTLDACGGSTATSPTSTPPGAYPVSVTATSGSIRHEVTFQLTVN